MGAKTEIEWTDSSWNPLRGCSHVSAGCDNCYAETMAARFSGSGQPYEDVVRIGMLNTRWDGHVELIEKHLLDPLKWGPVVIPCPTCGSKRKDCDCDEINAKRGATTQSRRIFVGSMSDLFHENVTDEMRDQIFAVMALCPQHIFQMLTKRPERMLVYIQGLRDGHIRITRIGRALDPKADISGFGPDHNMALEGVRGWPLRNVWLGVSVENQAAADERIPLLLRTPAATRFISVEPMLGKVTLPYGSLPVGPGFCLQREQILWCDKALDWVICGGESGPHARPMHPDWARSLRDQCAAAQVPFFFKQWGEWAEVEREYPDERFSPRMVQRGDAFVTPSGAYDLLGSDLRSTHELDGLPMRRVGKKAAGSLLDGLKYKSFPISER